MKPTISFSDFSKLDLCVGTVKRAKLVRGTDKLLMLEVDFGEKRYRKLVAGIAKTHEVEKLVGKQVVVVTNLEPREIRGVESQGMLLAADVNGKPVLLTLESEVPSGTKVR